VSRRSHIPSYRLHKATGQAVVTLPSGNGGRHDHYLGTFGTRESSPESWAEYDRLVAEWLANGRRTIPTPAASDLTIHEVLVFYWDHATAYYRHPDGSPTSEQDNIRLALRRLRQLYGHTPAAAFDSLALEALREAMIRDGLCRGRINKDVGRVKRLFKWASSKKLVPLASYQSLLTVGGLRAGRSAARETPPVGPVGDALVEETLPFLTPPVRAMVQLQRCTGMRPGEVVVMRGIDLDTSGPTWTYRPGSDQGPHGRHKTAWRGQQRVILIGPRGQEILKPWLRLGLHEYLFQPAEGRAAHDAERRRKRKSKVPPSQANRRPKRNPKKAPGDRYTVAAYDHAVGRACIVAHCLRCEACRRREGEKRRDWLARIKSCAGLKTVHWHPNQLRHTVGTEVRREAGLDAARAVLGHRSPAITETYAEIDVGKAAEVMGRLG